MLHRGRTRRIPTLILQRNVGLLRCNHNRVGTPVSVFWAHLFHNFLKLPEQEILFLPTQSLRPQKETLTVPSRRRTTTPNRNRRQSRIPTTITTFAHNNTTSIEPALPPIVIPRRPQRHRQPPRIHKDPPAHVFPINDTCRDERDALRPHVVRALVDGTSVEQLDAKPAAHVCAVKGELSGAGSRGGGAGEETRGVRIGREEDIEGRGAGLRVEEGIGGHARETVRRKGGGRLGERKGERGCQQEGGEMKVDEQHIEMSRSTGFVGFCTMRSQHAEPGDPNAWRRVEGGLFFRSRWALLRESLADGVFALSGQVSFR